VRSGKRLVLSGVRLWLGPVAVLALGTGRAVQVAFRLLQQSAVRPAAPVAA
jgi:hypothetical protein